MLTKELSFWFVPQGDISQNSVRRKNRMKIVKICLLAIVLSFANMTLAQNVSKVGTSAAPFLKIPVGSRGVGMGGAFVSVADDPSALFWNPGGLPRVGSMGVIVDHSPWLPGLQFNFAGAVVPVPDFGTIGVSVTALTTDQMDVTTPEDEMGTGETFDASFISIGFSYGVFLTDRFSIGATVKYINERIWHSTATGFAFDFGTIYNTPLEGLRLGFSISNFGPKRQIGGEDLNVNVDIDSGQKGNSLVVGELKTDEFDLPLLMQVGLSMDVWQYGGNQLTIAVDGINPSDNAQSINTGAEFSMFNKMFILSAGLSELLLKDNERGFTMGAGFNTSIDGSIKLNIGYAFQEFIHLNNVNRFSLMLLF
jgi:hypothetical protein